MIDAVRPLLDDGRIKLYCADSYDGASWSNQSIPLEERARQHGGYEAWVLDQVLPMIHADSGGPREVATMGCSLGAFHSLLFGLRRADVFPLALGFSGNYDASSWHGWGERAGFNAESLHVHIYRLRRRLAPFGRHIDTMVSVGYRLSKGMNRKDKG